MTTTQTNHVDLTPATYFWSGSSRAGEIAALAKHGRHVGVAVDALDKGGRSLAELRKLSSSHVKVFVDSGAFGEVKFDASAGGFVDVRPISDSDWLERLETYREIAKALGSRCYLVAPDKVGDQVVTLERLARYAEQVNELRELGANIIVPLQKGAMSQAAFDQAVTSTLGFGDYVRGIPSKKAAATVEEIAELCQELPADARIHLLGLGPWGARFDQVMAVVNRPAELVFCDSVRIKALVGRTNGRGGAPRILTALTDKAREVLGLADKGKLSADESFQVKFWALDTYLAHHAA